ncbi:hypothetical protein D0544_09265 [Aestuariirhabdus litorea]|uniref:ApeI dehydratase-like domain-containing protein n=2 Tax=Aestuariirhabdus litorea TaxID=2528527 RepID=A0A3P3VSS8_9GAMM|nr:hypothetical protein D0544_09265 [Aestuariirhabdus litorea]RWW98725.1 hypothetical protein DZC74_09250 [Endozoicomonadaceae bacterium GTF-13]
MSVAHDHPSLAGHFPGNPVVPAVVILSTLFEAFARQQGGGVALEAFPRVKFLRPLRAGRGFEVRYQCSGEKVNFYGTQAGEPLLSGSMRVTPRDG